MMKSGQNVKAESLFDYSLLQTNNEEERGDIYSELGSAKLNQTKYTEAITFYQYSMNIRQKLCTSKHPLIAKCYNSIGHVYDCMGEYSKAHSFYQSALDIWQNYLSSDYPTIQHAEQEIDNIERQQ